MSLIKSLRAKPMNISFVGAGNVAWHLAPALDNTDYGVREIYSRRTIHSSALAGRLYQANVMDSLDFSESHSDIFIIAVTDDAIEEVANEIIVPENAIVAHTSGTQPLTILSSVATPNIGVLYPLQTFSKSKKVEFKDIPFFVESANKETGRVLTDMAEAISKKVYTCSSDDRKALHVAAVFASNFTNHMLSISAEILEQHGFDLELLKPLIAETVNKSLAIGPEDAQTGPAHRGDLEVLDKHVEFLKKDKRLQEIYKIISQDILDKYQPD